MVESVPAREMKQIDLVFYGYFFEPTGYGEASRAYIRALHSAGVNLSLVNLAPRMLVKDSFIQSLLNRPITPTLHIYHGDPNLMAPLAHLFPRLIAMTAWETNRIPNKWVNILNRVLEVWVPSQHNVEVFRRDLTTPIIRMPHPYVPVNSLIDSSMVDRLVGLRKEDFVFYSIFTWQERKNPIGIIEAFLEAFPRHSDVFLVLKTIFGLTEQRAAHGEIADLMRRIRRKNGGNSKVKIVKEYACSAVRAVIDAMRGNHSYRNERVKIAAGFWSDDLVKALANRGNCYVSLHRGEGWCYPLFNAACNGTPVIATNHSGPMDYLQSDYQHMVPYVPISVAQNFANFTTNMLWAEPDISHAAFLMRYVYENQAEVIELAARGADYLKTKYSLDAIGRMAAHRLRTLSEQL